MIADADGRIEYVNLAYCSLNGYALPEVLGRSANERRTGLGAGRVFEQIDARSRRAEVDTGAASSAARTIA